MRKITYLLLILCCTLGAKAQTTVAKMKALVDAASVNTATIPEDWEVADPEGGVYSFNGSSTYIGGITNEAAAAAFEGDKIVTVAMWIYNTSSSYPKCMFGYGDQNSGVKIQVAGANKISATTKGISDLAVITDNRLSANNWTMVAVSFPAKNSSESQGRVYFTTNNAYYTRNDYKLSGMTLPADDGKKFAIGSGNQGNWREGFSGMIANVTIITSSGLLDNATIASIVGEAPYQGKAGLITKLTEKITQIQANLGDAVGYYDTSTATAAINTAQTVIDNANSTRDDIQDQIDALNALSIIMPQADKTYQIVSAYPNFESKQGVKKGMYAGSDGKVKWKTVSITDKTFFWTFTENGTNYSISNLSTNQYMGAWSENRQLLEDTAMPITLEPIGSGQFRLKNGSNLPMHTQEHKSGAGNDDYIVGWNGDVNSCSAWYIVEAEVKTEAIVTYEYTENGQVIWSQQVSGAIGQENPAPTFYNNFVTFDYPTQTLTGDVTLQLTNPTFNMPFAYGATIDEAPAVALDTHGNEANYPIYSSEGNIRVEFTERVNADEYRGGAVKSMDYAWKIVGNPFNGFKVYNVETGKYMVQPNDGDVEILLGDEGTVFQVYNPNLAGNPIPNEDFDASIGFCLKQVDRNNYINHRTTKLQGWTSPDGGSTFRAYTINATDVSYDLTFKAQYATVCLPFYSEVPAGLTLYSNTQVDDNNVLTLVPAGTLLKANTPYIVEADATGTYTFTNTSANTATESVTAGNLTGVLKAEGETVENGKYILALNKQTNQQAFYLTDGTVVCPKNKCYFTAPESLASVSAFFLGHNGETTGIENVFNGKNGETVIYNTAGQRINKLQKGINIVNGHKVLVK